MTTAPVQNQLHNKFPHIKTGAIILAAGASSRMGRSKQMLDVNGEALLARTISVVIAAGIAPVIVVLGAYEEKHRSILTGFDVDIALNAEWKKGMGSTIKAGLQTLLLKHSDTSAVLILVCDQPLLTADVISRIVARHLESKKPIVASAYRDTSGVPVLFDKTYFSKLSALPDDQGAKKLILQNPADVALIPFPGGEIDLDTMEDYERFLKQ